MIRVAAAGVVISAAKRCLMRCFLIAALAFAFPAKLRASCSAGLRGR
jgi:hypothetical protein